MVTTILCPPPGVPEPFPLHMVLFEMRIYENITTPEGERLRKRVGFVDMLDVSRVVCLPTLNCEKDRRVGGFFI